MIWVLTQEHNEYYQYGEYLVAVWKNKPTASDLEKLIEMPYGVWDISEEEYIEHLLLGGGRLKSEDNWFYLSQIKEGKPYQ